MGFKKMEEVLITPLVSLKKQVGQIGVHTTSKTFRVLEQHPMDGYDEDHLVTE